MKILFLSTMLIFSHFALASFDGKFQGPGKATFASGRNFVCPEVFLHLVQTKESLKILTGGYNCIDFSAYFDPSSFEISSGELFYQGKKVGTLSENRIEISVFDPEDGSTYHLLLSRTVKGLTYQEKWLVENEVALEVTGDLSRL
ncbi:MAG: hypothetical protein ACLGHN_00470 [Bacteriovoracia bacterium]